MNHFAIEKGTLIASGTDVLLKCPSKRFTVQIEVEVPFRPVREVLEPSRTEDTYNISSLSSLLCSRIIAYGS